MLTFIIMPGKIVIGDIHGALKALEQLLLKIPVQPDDQLIFLGDYVDGWSQSADVIAYLIELEKRQRCTFIKGNHDVWCSSWLAGNPPDEEWLFHGGNATVKSYTDFSKEQKVKHLDFFNRLSNYYVDGDRLFVHAGFTSIYGPSREHDEANFYWDRTLWESALGTDMRISKESNLYPKKLLLYNEIYIGHTPTVKFDSTIPMHACNVWNVDTGAAFTGKLSAMNVDTKEYWQSETVQRLYPNEKGRNR